MSLQQVNAIQAGAGPGRVPFVLTDAATITGLDGSVSDLFQVTLAGNRTLSVPTNMQPGQRIFIKVIQDGTGSRTLANGTGFLAPSGSWTLTATAAATDVIMAWYDGSQYFGVVIGLDFGA